MKQYLALIILAALCLFTSAAPPPRTEINPALLYWQAFAVLPDLPEEDHKYLFDTEWRNRAMDDRAGQLIGRYDASFRLIRQAADSKAPCDWGIDMAAGPEALLPHLAKAKHCAQIAVLRARWLVQQGSQGAARDDLLAAFVLGRNLAKDRVLISSLVQIAIENIISGFVVQQWPELQTETIKSILAGMDNAPARGTMAESMRTEKVAFYGWFVHKVQDLQVDYSTQEQKGLSAAEELLNKMVSEEGQSRKELANDVLLAAGKSLPGLLQYVQQMEPFYDAVEQAMALPYSDYQPVIDDLQARITTHPNLLLHEFFPAFWKVRLKEFRATARLAMLHAAFENRLNSATGLAKVQDPFGSGPFEVSRFVLDGIDRGFKLKSKLKMPEFEEVLIFAERPGPAFLIDGPSAGRKVL